MQTDMITRKKTNRLWVIIGVCSLGLYITACDNEMLSGNEKSPADVELCFDTSISDSPSTRADNGASVIEGTAFPDGTNTFGMFITDEAGDPLAIGSDDNMKLILTRTAGMDDSWSHTDKNDQSLPLSAKHGENINIIGYYPWGTGATATAVPFDLTGEASTWKDLMFLASPSGLQEVLDGNVIPLTFSHAYCWVSIELSKLTDKNTVNVSAVSIANSNNVLKRIINKGYINPKTGEVIQESSEAGSIVFNCPAPIGLPLNGSGTVKFDFLVPESMSPDAQDFEIMIQVTAKVDVPGSGSSNFEILSFPINKLYMNNKPDGTGGVLFGFEKGKRNSYDIIYNNSEMALSLANWEEVPIGDQTLGQGQAGTNPIQIWFVSNTVASSAELKPVQLQSTNHINHTYLGEVANNNNGKYVTTEPVLSGGLFAAWKPFVLAEPFNPKLMVANKDAAGGGLLPWKDGATGVLLAKQACIEFREGGYTDWRLPRISECYMLVYGKPSGTDTRLSGDEYWSGTERSATESLYIVKDSGVGANVRVPRVAPKTAKINVRCVRDTDKPNPGI